MSLISGMVRTVLALLACFLPRAVWVRWSDQLPVFRMVLPSALLTLGVGLSFGVVGYLDFAIDTASKTNDAVLQIAEQQAEGRAARPVEASPGMAASLTMLAMFTFAFFTAKGAACTYLTISGLYRTLGAIANDPHGDPILSLLRLSARAAAGRTRESLSKIDQERREGREVPDRMTLGVDAGFPRADLVVFACRRKLEWTPGAVLFTRRGCYRIGEAVSRETPEGLRTLYPLTEIGQAEVMRKVVRCELPRLESELREEETVPV